ncbi:hypothetical protein HPB48_012007 [Haemaphysalis longicornis]|uniref:Uncharacterized protein n=1 Tax=Haemaphysalis longicornis TaxID=44386 RepID=A0A9J6GAC8_HAELO|nr:hypothetical protein HPB48_012007 [Haemaphysalis longicornis]
MQPPDADSTPPPPVLVARKIYTSPAPAPAQNVMGFLLSKFRLEWAQDMICNIEQLESQHPDVWQQVQVTVEEKVRQLQRGMPSRRLPAPTSSSGAAAAAAASSQEESGSDDDDDTFGTECGFAVGAQPVLRKWACGWWAVQRVGPTATLTNEINARMDPVAARRRNIVGEDEDIDDFEELLECIGQSSAIPRPEFILTALDVTVFDDALTPALARVLERWNETRQDCAVVLRFVASAAFVASSTCSGVSVDCSRIAHLSLHVDDMSAKFATALGTVLNLRPSLSVQVHAKSWRLTDVGKLLLFRNEPRQVTLNTPFVKRVANFLGSLPAGCRELVLPQFGSRTPTPDLFSQLTATKGDRDENFQRVTVGECKVSKDGGMASTTLHSLLAITADVLCIEQRFPAATVPFPVPSTVLNAGASSSSIIAATAGKSLLYTSTLSVTCSCRTTQQQQHQVLTPVCAAIVATIPNATMGVYLPTRCLRCGVTVFNRCAGAQLHSTDLTTVETLFMETMAATTTPDRQVVDFVQSAMPNVRNMYLGEGSKVGDQVIVKFVGRFKRLHNLVTLVPRYSTRATRTSFLESVIAACPELHRVCLTRRWDKRDPRCFSYGVVPPPTKSDYVVSRVRWGVEEPSVAFTPAYAAAFARCLMSSSHPPHATEGLYMFKH